MTDFSHLTSTRVVDDAAASVAAALAALNGHESDNSAALSASDRSARIAAEAITRLDGNAGAWHGILSEIADKVRSVHEDLAVLDVDLKQSLDAIAVTRKHLQSASGEAASGSDY